MRSHPIRKALLGVATVVAVVMSVAVPASAGTANATITSGIVRIHDDPVVDFPIPGEGEDPCSDPLPDQTLTVDFDGNGNWSLPLPQSIKARFQLPTGPAWYQMDLAFLTGQGTYVPAGGNVHNLASIGTHVTVEAKLYQLAPPDDCDKEPVICTLRARLVVGPVSTITSASMPNPVVGDTILINATSNATGGVPLTPVGQCDPVFNAFSGMDVSLVNLNLIV